MIDRRTLIATGATLALPGCSRSFAALAPGTTRLRVAGDRLFIAATIDGVAIEALLDTAAETSIVDATLAARIGLRGGTTATARGTGAATTTATLVGGVTITVAGVTLRPAAIGVIDLSDVSRRVGTPIRLIVGRELFDAARIAMDIDAATLAVIAPGGSTPGVALPLTARRGIETVPVIIEGIAGDADFDLGNGGTVLVGAAFAARHGLPGNRPTRTIDGGGIGGAARQTSFTVATLDLAGQRFTDVPVAIDASPTAADANIGVRLLRRFGIITDFPNRAVWLEFRG